MVAMKDVEVRGVGGDGGPLPGQARWPIICTLNQPLGYLPGSIAVSGCGGPHMKFDDVEESSFD